MKNHKNPSHGMSSAAGQHAPRKRFGQNFLHDQSIIHSIVAAIAPQPGQLLVEIGPGQGALTLPLLKLSKVLQAIELDRDLIGPLQASAQAIGSLNILSADVLKVDFSALAVTLRASNTSAPEAKMRVVGNLPYNISSPLLFHLMEHLPVIEDMHFMLQKEVVDRMAAEPGGKEYGRLSVMLQARCAIDALFDVPPESFFPAPKVVSAIVRLRPHAVQKTREELFGLEKLVKQAFSARRKTLSNTLKGVLSTEQIRAAGIDPIARAETLGLAQFEALVKVL